MLATKLCTTVHKRMQFNKAECTPRAVRTLSAMPREPRTSKYSPKPKCGGNFVREVEGAK